ncbi:MFS transporter [Devosia ginsengisoli]|uniref:MFS transporter n=1 Tax=Devosia ginsengisoli TaxID=400770 RepID=UPI0026F29D5A|nr:MFS transporter [Devosia ginsengisoli]MCR6673525.1 MFS transporter [Devosia ginsengisoli]
MASVIKIYALFLGSALLMFGGGLQGLLLSVRGAEEGFSLLSLGLIGTGWSVGFVAGSITVPIVVRKVGHIRAFSVMAAIGTVTILLNLLLINDISWILLRALSGFCFAGAAMIVESWLNEVAENKSRGTIFSIYVTINMAASTLGQISMSITGTAGYVPFVLGAISFICAVLPTALTSSPQPRPLSSAKIDVGLLYRTSPVAAIAAFSVGMANGAFGTLAPVYGHEQGLDAGGISLLFALAAILGATAQIPFGRLSDRIDRRLVLIGLSGFAAVVGALTALINPGPNWMMFVLFAAYGFAANPIYAVAVAHANDFAKDGDFAKIAGGMLLILGVGLAIGPAVASLIMGAWSPVGLFIVTATFHGALAITAWLRMRIRKSVDASERAPFQPMGDKQVTPETIVLDPRADSDSADVPVAHEAPVPDELIETPEEKRDVQDGTI